MPKRQRRRRRSWGRTLLLFVFVFAALYAGVHCIFRAPQLPAETPAQEAEPQGGQAVDAAAQAELAAQAAHRPQVRFLYRAGLRCGRRQRRQ